MLMGQMMEAVLAIMGLMSGFYALALLLGQPGPVGTKDESVSPKQTHTIHSPAERLAA